MKLLRKITAIMLTAVMIAVSAVSASAVNIKYYNKDFDIDEIFAGATVAESGKTYLSYIENRYDSVFYSFNTGKKDTVTIDAEVGLSHWYFNLFDATGEIVFSKKVNIKSGSGGVGDIGNLGFTWNKSKKTSKVTITYNLKKGRYLAMITSDQTESYTGKVRFTANFSAAASSSSSTLGLISESREAIQKNSGIYKYLGQDLYFFTDKEGNSNIYRIDDDVLDKWRETGKFKAQKITVDKKISSHKGWTYSTFLFNDDNFAKFTCKINGKSYYYAVKYNASANKITSYYKSDCSFGMSPSGYISEWSTNKSQEKAMLDIYDPKGKKVKSLTFDYKEKENLLWYFYDCEYCGYTTSRYNEKTGEWSGSVYLIDHNGNKKKISDTPVRGGQFTDNFFSIKNVSVYEPTEVYLFDKKKTYNLFGKKIAGFIYNGYDYSLMGFASRFYGTKAVGIYSRTLADGGHEDVYILVDIEKGEYLSKLYYNMATNDGKIFRVRNENNQYGYIDANGKELGMFDDAAVFGKNGKYAPVCENGKVHFVDRNMKQVSKDYDLGKFPLLTTYGDNVFFWTDLKNYNFMTFA